MRIDCTSSLEIVLAKQDETLEFAAGRRLPVGTGALETCRRAVYDSIATG
jgi:hypothetical protein